MALGDDIFKKMTNTDLFQYRQALAKQNRRFTKKLRYEKRIAAEAGNTLGWPHSHLPRNAIYMSNRPGKQLPKSQQEYFKKGEKYPGQRTAYLKGAWLGD